MMSYGLCFSLSGLFFTQCEACDVIHAVIVAVVHLFSLLPGTPVCGQTQIYPFCCWWIYLSCFLGRLSVPAQTVLACVFLDACTRFCWVYLRAGVSVSPGICPAVFWRGGSVAVLHQECVRVPVVPRIFSHWAWSSFNILDRLVYSGLGVSSSVNCLFRTLAPPTHLGCLSY